MLQDINEISDGKHTVHRIWRVSDAVIVAVTAVVNRWEQLKKEYAGIFKPAEY